MDAIGRKGQAIREQHIGLRYQPDWCGRGQNFACVRYRAADGSGLFWRCACIVFGQPNGSLMPPGDPAAVRAMFPLHHYRKVF